MRRTVIEQAGELLGQIRRLECAKTVVVARAEREIEAKTAKAKRACSKLDRPLDALQSRLLVLLASHPKVFDDPRSISTPDGRFGYRKSTCVEVTDEEHAIEDLMDKGYDDCMAVKRTLIKSELRKRLEGGEKIRGVLLDVGDDAFFEVHKALIDEARKHA